MKHTSDDVLKRRALLNPAPAPGRPYDYVVELRQPLFARTKNPITLVIRYVPEKFILAPERLNAYLKQSEKMPHDSIEALADRMLSDLLNELIPFWVEILLEQQEGEVLHRVLREERQPDWDNPSLLARLAPL